ncbi:hypothetical protein SISNIDRAFT_419416, partial [Sistotremastrum niveocremeum HHB9708]
MQYDASASAKPLQCPNKATCARLGHAFKTRGDLIQHWRKSENCRFLYKETYIPPAQHETFTDAETNFGAQSEVDSTPSPPPSPVAEPPARSPSPDPANQRARVEDALEDDPYIYAIPRYHPPDKSIPRKKSYEDYRAELANIKKKISELEKKRKDPSPISYAPFASKLDWEVNRWLVEEGVSDNAINRLCAIDGIVKNLGMSDHNCYSIKKTINQLPAVGDGWNRTPITIDEHPTSYNVYSRDILSVIKHLFSRPEFKDTIAYGPQEQYADKETTSRLYNEMWTGDWWCRTQVRTSFVDCRCTVIPILISTDKTQLTSFGGDHAAYPVYMTIGNIDKETRKKPSSGAWRLIGYLPTGKFDEDGISDAAARRARFRLFHACMGFLLAPLVKAGKDGITLVDPHGNSRHCYPILAGYPSDYPEQCLVCTNRQNVSCPKCDTDDFSINAAGAPRNAAETLRILEEAGECLRLSDAKDLLDPPKLNFISEPFWAKLPHCDIHSIITPDILHQLLQGMVKHLVSWLSLILSKEELDFRFKALPPIRSCRHFPRGISVLKNTTGSEHRDIGKQLMGCLIGKVDDSVLRATRGLLDFLYLASYKSHSTETLQYMKDALNLFHANKNAFFRYGGRDSASFDYPKLHSLQHYIQSILDFGTTDNYNTETTERLHIDFVKHAYEHTNHKNFIEQMIAWLARIERVGLFKSFVNYQQNGALPLPKRVTTRVKHQQVLALHATVFAVEHITKLHDIPTFPADLETFFKALQPSLPRPTTRSVAPTLVPTPQQLAVYKRVKFISADLQMDSAKDIVDVANATPCKPATSRSAEVPARYDSVLVDVDDVGEDAFGVALYRVAIIKLIFSIPTAARQHPSSSVRVPDPGELAYVEWLDIAKSKHEPSGMFAVTRARRNIRHEVILLSRVRRTCHLIPQFGDDTPRGMNYKTVLLKQNSFWLNNYIDNLSFQTLY